MLSNALTRRAFISCAGAASSAAAFTASAQERVGVVGSSKRVVVVGAGVAGLISAFELVQNGHNVILLEARMRPGGRI